jgi:hypothetical protein
MLSSKMTQSIKIQYVFFHVIPFLLYLQRTREPIKNKSPFNQSIAIRSARLSPATTVPGSLFHRPPPPQSPQGPIRRRGRGPAPLPRLAPRQAQLAAPPPDGGRAVLLPPPLPHGLSVRERRTLPTGIEILRLLISVELHMVC